MTKSQEKAKELVGKFREYSFDFGVNENSFAKQSALIAVDEIIDYMRVNNIFIDSFWFDVRLDIVKLETS
jgi:hypothetical protein